MAEKDNDKLPLSGKELQEFRNKTVDWLLESLDNGWEDESHNPNDEVDDKYKDQEYTFYKENPNDAIWWVDHPQVIGEHLFSFDKKEVFNLFADYPWKLTKEQKEIFDKENPFWADYFKCRE